MQSRLGVEAPALASGCSSRGCSACATFSFWPTSEPNWSFERACFPCSNSTSRAVYSSESKITAVPAQWCFVLASTYFILSLFKRRCFRLACYSHKLFRSAEHRLSTLYVARSTKQIARWLLCGYDGRQPWGLRLRSQYAVPRGAQVHSVL